MLQIPADPARNAQRMVVMMSTQPCTSSFGVVGAQRLHLGTPQDSVVVCHQSLSRLHPHGGVVGSQLLLRNLYLQFHSSVRVDTRWFLCNM